MPCMTQVRQTLLERIVGRGKDDPLITDRESKIEALCTDYVGITLQANIPQRCCAEGGDGVLGGKGVDGGKFSGGRE